MRHEFALLLCAAALLRAAAAPAQEALPHDGLDTAWNGGGTALTSVLGYSVGYSDLFGGLVKRDIAVVVQPDGRIVLAGPCVGADSLTTCMARLLPSGVRDYAFGPSQSGAFAFSQFASWPPFSLNCALTRQSDGRLVVAGTAAGSAGGDNIQYAAVARLTAAGTLDTGVPAQPVRFEFAHNATASFSFITAAALQADGKLVVAGLTYAAGSNPPSLDFAVARLRANLTLDPTFNGTGMRVVAFDLGGGGTDMARALAIQNDGKIVVVGTADTTSSGSDAAVLRLNADGTLDSSFGSLGRATFDFGGHHLDDVVNDVKVDGAGRIWLAGSYQQAFNDTDFLVARLRPDGTLDTAWRGTGYETLAFNLDADTTQRETDAASSLLLSADGTIVLAGSASNGEANGAGTDFAAVRLLTDGTPDPRFGPIGSPGKLHGRFAPAMPINRATGAAFGGSGIVLAGLAADRDQNGDTTDGQFGVAMIRVDRIFRNGFER